jgi:5-methyltetrahydropteroyltriglutamate--homocysteine methyltransferase
MYEALVREVEGFKFVGHVRSWDNKYYRKAAVVSEIKWEKPIYLSEFKFTKEHSDRMVKVPFTGPYTVTDWSFNEFYQKRLESSYGDPRELKKKAYSELLFEVSRQLIRPEIESLVSNGARWIQIDEPALSTQPGKEQVINFVQAINEAIKGFDCKFSLHVCYSTDYTSLFPELLEASGISQYVLEFSNKDSNRTGDSKRTGYDVVKLLGEYNAGKEIGLGVIDVHDDRVESPTLVRDRILHASKLIRDPALVYVNPDCGLRTRTWKTTFSKLVNMVKGTELALKSV